MQVESVEFKNAEGYRLHGQLHTPLGEVRGTALFAHCFTCSSESKAAVIVSRALSDQGFRVLRFDFTGLGASAGAFAESSFSTSVSDLLAAATFLEQTYSAPDVLIGHSLGGTAALRAAAKLPDCRGVVTIAAPARAEHVAHLLGPAQAELETEGIARVDIGGRPFTIRREFVEDLAAQPPLDELRRLRCALLVMHAPLDRIVEIDNASEIFSHALHPKSFVSLDDADHLLTRRVDAEYAAAVIAAWSSRYLPARKESAEADKDWVTAETGREGFLTSVCAAGHPLTVDEPATVHGGSGRGPSPYDLLGAALASCTSMTLQMYARHKGIDLDTATTRVRHTKIHAEDCADCETREGRIDRFERELELNGKFDAATRKRLTEIAERCPVHKTLAGEILIRTSLRGGHRSDD